MENPVDNDQVEDPQEKICPYMEIACTEDCPAWLDGVEDCLFHVCMTEVKEVFLDAARLLDDKLCLEPGSGMATLTGIRNLVKLEGGAENTQMIGAVLGQMLQEQAARIVSNLTPEEITGAISRAEEVIGFGFENLVGSEPDEGEDGG